MLNLIIIALSAIFATFLGGLFALRFRDKLHLVLGFSAGAVIGVAFFDLLPEAMELSANYFSFSLVATLIGAGFIFYLILDRLAILHSHHEENCGHCENKRGRLGAGSLSLHSFLDGLMVGVAFQISAQVGLVVAVAVLAHDFSDGINTVNLILKNGGGRKQALRWLAIDSLAPALGILATNFFNLQSEIFGLILAIFCGFFLYIGASELLPESHHRHPTHWTTISTLIGIGFLFALIKLAGGV